MNLKESKGKEEREGEMMNLYSIISINYFLKKSIDFYLVNEVWELLFHWPHQLDHGE